MPEVTMTVLCCDGSCPCAIAVGVLIRISENNYVCENDFYKLFHVTHWMYLPEKPKE